jgi:cytidylate kinase
MDFVQIIGPPAVGKMTVGQELARLTGYKLLYNTMTADLLIDIFPRGTPQFGRLLSEIQTRIVEEAAKAGVSIINTAVWAMDSEGDTRVMEARQDAATRHGGTVYLVELYAPLDVRLDRNRHEHRARHKPKQQRTLTDEIMGDMETTWRMSSAGELDGRPRYLRIDNTEVPAAEAAQRICDAFGFAAAG